MSNGIYLTLEQYKDKDLPITITINGHTYHSQFALATAQTTWFEMGKQHGMELGADNTYSDKEMSRMHDAWYDEGYKAGKAEATSDIEMQWMHDQWYNEGYEAGYKQGKQAGISKINLNTEPVEQTELSKEYDKGFTKGYAEGYNDAKGEDDYCKDCKEEPGKDEQNAKEIPGEWLSHIEAAKLEGYADGFNDGKEQGFEEGFMNLKLILKK